MAKLNFVQQYIKDHDAAPKERKHIVLLDGTWNDETGEQGNGRVTNVVNLSRIFRRDHDKQIVRYHRGVGNDNDNSLLGKLWKGADGKAVHAIVDRAYARFIQEWQNGDRIYIFGFSRGSAAARILASKIHKEGIPASVKITLKPKVNKETNVIEQRIDAVEYDRSKEKKVRIEFVGVWDTVSSFGAPNNFLRMLGFREKDMFTDQHIAENINRAVHLLAMDETRNEFVPSLMNHKENVTHEVWFPGVHSDVGGSYLRNEIGQITLHYMFKKLTAWHTENQIEEFLIDQEAYDKYVSESVEVVHLHLQGLNWKSSVREIKTQSDGKKSSKKPLIHQIYHEISSKRNTYSVREKKKKVNGVRVDQVTNFQYMPFNVKVLRGDYEVVS
ncbi:MAG: DUF2235 domain-containing protein [Reichenbachiella sp.]|uniref:DUF2235 domain-containing protein n=1 Tax=Reichenbachiella sp. TaxID=2184521 RepID=UPI00326551A5